MRYHLQDFTDHDNEYENEKELINPRHGSLRNVVERIFGISKLRFKKFMLATLFLLPTQAYLMLASATLHNFLRK